MEVIREAGERLQGPQIKQRLEAAGRVHGDSTVNNALARLTGTKQVLTNIVNDEDDFGEGYGLAEWE